MRMAGAETQMANHPFCNKSMSSSKARRLRLLQTDNQLADCEFLVGETPTTTDSDDGEQPPLPGQRLFRCHKMLLATASEVFERMFYGEGEYMEHGGPVCVPEVSPSSFARFLRYIYTYEMDDDEYLPLKELGELFYLADKYMLQDLMDAVVTHLKNKRNWLLGDVWPMYDLACLHENLPLLLMCYEEITKYPERLLTHRKFYRLNVNNLKRLMVLLSQQPHVPTSLLFSQLEEYGRRNNYEEKRESADFLKLVDAACQLDFNKMSMAQLDAGPATSYLFNYKTV